MSFGLIRCQLQDTANVASRWDGEAVSVPSKLLQLIICVPKVLLFFELCKFLRTFFCIFHTHRFGGVILYIIVWRFYKVLENVLPVRRALFLL